MQEEQAEGEDKSQVKAKSGWQDGSLYKQMRQRSKANGSEMSQWLKRRDEIVRKRFDFVQRR